MSAGGATRLLAARDGWCAITLSRPDDVAAVPALLHADDVPADPWPTLQRWVAARPVSAIVERAGLLDIPAAALGEAAGRRGRGYAASGPEARRAAPACWWPICRRCGRARCAGSCWPARERRSSKSKARAARTAPGPAIARFFDWINGDKLSYCLDFDRQADELRELLAVADVVIEGSRPAALARRRLGPDDVAPRAGPNLAADHRV